MWGSKRKMTCTSEISSIFNCVAPDKVSFASLANEVTSLYYIMTQDSVRSPCRQARAKGNSLFSSMH